MTEIKHKLVEKEDINPIGSFFHLIGLFGVVVIHSGIFWNMKTLTTPETIIKWASLLIGLAMFSYMSNDWTRTIKTEEVEHYYVDEDGNEIIVNR